MKKEDEGIRAVRDVRKTISAEFGNDPEKLVEHYLKNKNGFVTGCFSPSPYPVMPKMTPRADGRLATC